MVAQIVPLTLGLYFGLVASVIYGQVLLAVVLAWVASPVIFFFYAVRYERHEYGRGESVGQVFKSVFDPKAQAWSFLLGDIVILPAAFGVAAHSWGHRPVSGLSSLELMGLGASLVAGAIAGLVFHFVMDRAAYEAAGFRASLDSPTKWVHDFVTYPAMFGALLFTGLPLVAQVSWHMVVVLMLVGIWAVLGVVVDGRRGKTLVPWGHPPFDLERGQVVARTSR